MSAPAVSVAPLAVLVLAWDEATPAVRTLLAAVQAASSPIDSILLVVPQVEAPAALLAEEYQEYLPLPADGAGPLAEPLPSTPPAAETAEILPPAARPGEPAALGSPKTSASAALLPAAAQPAPAAPVALANEPATPAKEASISPSLAWSAVRVLGLSSFSLPELAQLAGQPLPALTWTAALEFPAAPYIGASAPASHPALGEIATPGAAAQVAPASAKARQPALSLVSEPADLAPDLEADLLPTAANKPASAELAPTKLLPTANALLTGKLPPAAPATTEPAPERAGWPEALAALRQAVLLTEPAAPVLAAEQDEASGLAQAMRMAGRPYAAPNLNFQIIQYARFAVPLALADQPFGAIYAPAWPTWLAAQELRQRTGRPLVLHVTALAAPASESLATATGWQAELQRQAMRCADLVLTETTALAHRLCHELALSAAAVRTIAAADVEAIAQALRTVQPPAKASRG